MTRHRSIFASIITLAALAFASTARSAEVEPLDKGDDAPCEGGAGCAKNKSNWLSVALQQDFLLLQQEDGICSQSAQTTGNWTCLRSRTETQYYGTPSSTAPYGVEKAGVHFATTRVLFGYDRVFFRNFALGTRVGFVPRGGGPRPGGADGSDFFLWHLEGRMAFWPGSDPFTTGGLRPWVSLAGGMAQVDAMVRVRVTEDRSVPPPPNQLDNADQQTLHAWRRAGRGFASLGLGAAYIFESGFGLLAEVRWMQLFPDMGGAGALQLGVLYGL